MPNKTVLNTEEMKTSLYSGCSVHLGCYSETGFHISMDRNFVCLWCRHNCRSQVIDLSLPALISWFIKSIIGFLNSSNLHAIISISLIFNLHWVNKIFLLYLKKFITMLVSSFNLSQPFNYKLYLFYQKNGSNQRSILYVYGPGILCCTRAALAWGAHTAEFGITSAETACWDIERK